MSFPVGQAIPIRYFHGISGATVLARVVDEVDGLFGAELTLTENAALAAAGYPGWYEGTFTPDVVGHWKVAIKVGSARYGQAFYHVGGSAIYQPSMSYRGAIDAGAPGSTTIHPCDDLSGFGDDYFNTDWVMVVIRNDNAHGVVPETDVPKDITDYVSATGTFTTVAFGANVEADDIILVARRERFSIERVPLSTIVTNSLAYRISQYLASGDGDFLGGTALPSNVSLYDILAGANGIPGAWPGAAAPAAGVSMAEVLQAIHDYVDGLVASDEIEADLAHASGTPTQNSIIDYIMNKDGGQTFDRTKSSLEALYDNSLYRPVADAITNTTIRDVVGNKTDAAVQDADATQNSIIALLKGAHDVLWDDAGIAAWAAAAAPANGVSLSEAIRFIYSEQFGTEFDGSPDLYDVLVDGYDSSAIVGDIDGSLHEILKAMAGATWTAESLEAIYNLLDAVLDLTETGGTLTATGGEDTIYINNAPSGVFEPRVVFIDLTNMQAGDSVRIRETYRIKSGGALLHLDGVTYAGVQPADQKVIQVVLKPNRYGVEVTLEQTAGVNRDYDWEVFYSG
jgi:hypothetical protein